MSKFPIIRYWDATGLRFILRKDRHTMRTFPIEKFWNEMGKGDRMATLKAATDAQLEKARAFFDTPRRGGGGMRDEINAEIARRIEVVPAFVLIDEINGQAFGPFATEEDAENAARTGAEVVGGSPWGEDGWVVLALQPGK